MFIALMAHSKVERVYILYQPWLTPRSARTRNIDLGIIMSKNLTFHEHIKRMMAKCYRKLFIIKKCFYVTNIKITLCFIYPTYIGIWFCDMDSAQPYGN